MLVNCTEDVKITWFEAYCTPLYTAHLWRSYSKAKFNQLQANALQLPQYQSAFCSESCPHVTCRYQKFCV